MVRISKILRSKRVRQRTFDTERPVRLAQVDELMQDFRIHEAFQKGTRRPDMIEG